MQGMYLVGGEFVFGIKNSSLPRKDVVQKHVLIFFLGVDTAVTNGAV